MEARRLFAQAGLEEVGDDHIGKLLCTSPTDPNDGLWPHEAVREVLEQVPEEVIAEAFWIGRRNLRGVTTRSLTDGGKQERALAQDYQSASDRMHDQWPRTADIIAKLAASYLSDAKYHDDEVARRQL